jgi:6-pyruvoyl-tetrahydropterin synthase
MYTLGVSDHIMIAHRIADPAFGRAQQLHGATYSIVVEVRVPQLGPHSVVMDIGLLRSLLRSVLDELDYCNLDEHPAFAGLVSTTERVVEHVAARMAERLVATDSDPGGLRNGSLRVTAHESPVAYAAYERPIHVDAPQRHPT